MRRGDDLQQEVDAGDSDALMEDDIGEKLTADDDTLLRLSNVKLGTLDSQRMYTLLKRFLHCLTAFEELYVMTPFASDAMLGAVVWFAAKDKNCGVHVCTRSDARNDLREFLEMRSHALHLNHGGAVVAAPVKLYSSRTFHHKVVARGHAAVRCPSDGDER